MSYSQIEKSYLDIDDLVARTGLSEATIWRLKRTGKIPFYQPGGKGGRVKFPVDAIEVAGLRIPREAPADEDFASPKRLPGPRPKWMSSQPNNKNQ